MAKKYRAVESKVHWLTWTIMGAIVVGMVILLVALQPSSKTVFYDSYYAVATDANFEKKLPKNNKFILINRLEDGFLGFNKGIYSVGQTKDQVSIVYFGAPSLENGSSHVADVYARLYGSASMKPKIDASDLSVELKDNVKLYYFEHSGDKFDELVTKLNDRYEDAEIAATSVPFILVLLNNEVLDYTVLNQANIPTQLENFYDDVFQLDEVQALLPSNA